MLIVLFIAIFFSACVSFENSPVSPSEDTFDQQLRGAWLGRNEKEESDVILHVGTYKKNDSNVHVILHSKNGEIKHFNFNGFMGEIGTSKYLIGKMLPPYQGEEVEYHGYKIARYQFIDSDHFTAYSIDSCDVEKLIINSILSGKYRKSRKICYGNYITSLPEDLWKFMAKNGTEMFKNKMSFERINISGDYAQKKSAQNNRLQGTP
jgi:hypothetical protein